MAFTPLFILMASLASSGSSVALSQTLSKGGSNPGYLTVYFFLSFLLSAVLQGIFSFAIPFSLPMALLGGGTGILVIGLMKCLGQALRTGPSGLTFAFQNAGALFPGLILPLLFGTPFGFSLGWMNLLGMGLVVLGLFVAAGSGGIQRGRVQKEWLVYALGTCLLQGLILSVFQWHTLLFTPGLPSSALLPFTCPHTADAWFTPALFFSAGIYQACSFFFTHKALPTRIESVGGAVGGLANGASTFFLLHATAVASVAEKAMLFPLFTVAVILLCQLYGKFFYRESIPWKGSLLTALGVFVGMA